MIKETKTRSVIKSITWRFMATLTTVSLVYIFTGRIDMAMEIGGIEVILKILIYFIHERVWYKIRFGKKEIEPFVVWFTGLPGSGKTAIGVNLVEKLQDWGLKADHLDGGNIRHIFPETGFTKEEVDEHIKRVGYLASRMENKGVFVVASFVSPYRESRNFVKNLCNNFIEVYLSAPMDVCEQRESRGLYKKARAGEIKNLPGVDVEYEEPDNPELVIDTGKVGIEESTDKVLKRLKKYI
ncbi:MAG: adenylyl-sulfate kinase [bacterium]